jgi:hypothetical protein
MRRLLTMLKIALISFGVVTTQSRLISGKVDNLMGIPVPSSAMRLKMGTIVSAGENRNFKNNPPSCNVLNLKSIDFETTSAEAGTFFLFNIAMAKRDTRLDEVEVTELQIRTVPKSIDVCSSLFLSIQTIKI